MKKALAINLALLLIVFMGISCSAKTAKNYPVIESDQVVYSESYNELSLEESESLPEFSMDRNSNVQVEIPQGRKVILNADLTMETVEFDKTIKSLSDAIKRNGGYVSDSSQSGSGDGNSRRDSYITARIPTDKYNNFLSDTASAGTIIYKKESSTDVTSQYIDVEVRLITLKQQEERLLALLETVGDLENLIIIEERLSDVRYEIERFEIQKRTFDDLTSYSTVSISVQEVKIITETDETFFPQLADSISGSWNNFLSGLQGFIFRVIYALPTLILWAGIICGIVIFVKKMIKKRRHAKNKTAESISSEISQKDDII